MSSLRCGLQALSCRWRWGSTLRASAETPAPVRPDAASKRGEAAHQRLRRSRDECRPASPARLYNGCFPRSAKETAVKQDIHPKYHRRRGPVRLRRDLVDAIDQT